MDTDPNWFYSTLAQSTAAIVGLVGAFLIQRILATRSEIAADRVRLALEARDVWRQVLALRGCCNRFLSTTAPALHQAIGASTGGAQVRIEQGPMDVMTPKSFRSTFDAFRGPLTLPDPAARKQDLERACEAAREALAKLPGSERECARQLRDQGQIDSLHALGPADKALVQALGAQSQPWDWIVAFPHVVRVHRSSVSSLGNPVADGIRALRERIAPRSYQTLLGILFFLLVVGVVAPMGWLVARNDVQDGWLLVLFAIGAVALLAYYWYELNRLLRVLDLSAKT